VLDNTDEGWNFNVTAQVRKTFGFGLHTSLAYTFLEAKNNLKSTEIASVLWQNQPVKGDPNKPELSYSEFGNRHRIVGAANYQYSWSPNVKTSLGLFLEVADGNRFAGAGGNRYSYIYAGDVNGDGYGGNDLIYIPRDQSEITFAGSQAEQQAQWQAFNAFIEQDDYLSSHRGEIAERFGAINPWWSNIDLRILQNFSMNLGSKRQTFQLNFDVLNVANLINSDWGVRKVASPAATTPLALVGFDAQGEPIFNFVGPEKTFVDDPSLFSRWRIQLGLRYFFN
jgi:hypothetical protein